MQDEAASDQTGSARSGPRPADIWAGSPACRALLQRVTAPSVTVRRARSSGKSTMACLEFSSAPCPDDTRNVPRQALAQKIAQAAPVSRKMPGKMKPQPLRYGGAAQIVSPVHPRCRPRPVANAGPVSPRAAQARPKGKDALYQDFIVASKPSGPFPSDRCVRGRHGPWPCNDGPRSPLWASIPGKPLESSKWKTILGGRGPTAPLARLRLRETSL